MDATIAAPGARRQLESEGQRSVRIPDAVESVPLVRQILHEAVSYTHLDVYKRQTVTSTPGTPRRRSSVTPVSHDMTRSSHAPRARRFTSAGRAARPPEAISAQVPPGPSRPRG